MDEIQGQNLILLQESFLVVVLLIDQLHLHVIYLDIRIGQNPSRAVGTICDIDL